MPAFSNFVINDGAATPVARTFAPKTLIGNEARYVDRSGGITLGYPEILIASALPSKTSKIAKTRVKVMMPVMEVLNAATYNGITPAPTLAYSMGFDGTFFAHERSTLQDRKHILAFTKNALALALIASLVENQESIY